MAKFTGVWGVFENLDEMTDTIEEVRSKGIRPTTLSPCPRHEIDHALGPQFTLVPWIGLVFACYLYKDKDMPFSIFMSNSREGYCKLLIRAIMVLIHST